MKLTASIVLYKTDPSELDTVYGCWRASSLKPELTLIDNSPEPRADTARYPGAHYVFLGRNSGYGAGHNEALKRRGDAGGYHCFLNSDLRFGPDCFESIIRFMEGHHEAGLVGPRVLNSDGSLQFSCRLLPSPLDLAVRRLMPGPLRGLYARRDALMEMRRWGYDSPMPVPFLSGCFLVARMNDLIEIGAFDERYFMYMEDLDLSRRFAARGRAWFFPGAEAIHDHRRASYEGGPLMKAHVMSAIRYFNKWGWLLDSERRRINEAALVAIKRRRD
jgi:hypothetical protein